MLAGQFLGRSQMVQVVVIDFSLFRAVAIYQRQGFEAVRFVQVGAVLIPGFFSNEAVALPEEFGSGQAVGLSDTAAEGVVFVVPGAAIRCGDAREPVLAVVCIPGDQFLSFTSTFLNQVAEFVVFVVAVTMHGKPVTAHIGRLTA